MAVSKTDAWPEGKESASQGGTFRVVGRTTMGLIAVATAQLSAIAP